jgi:L-asparaginase
MKKDILIINTGGTFNKIYNEINGQLIINKNSKFIKRILNISKINDIKVKGLIYKDSLDINIKDRKKLKNYIKKSKYKKIIIVHGTDTMSETAIYLNDKINNKQIVLTGSMMPYSINPIEATSNLMSAFGFLISNKNNNIYICMHGLIKQHTKIKKNKKLGIFECQ